MTELRWLPAIGCLVVGGALGTLFFWSLWYTLRRIPYQRHAVRLALGSFLLRIGAAFAVFYGVARTGHWSEVLFCLGGFVLARIIWAQAVSSWTPRPAEEGDDGHGHLA
jgi:F1F0 ATPase subunit 2